MKIPTEYTLVNRTWKVHVISSDEMAEVFADLAAAEAILISEVPHGLTVPDHDAIYLNKDSHKTSRALEATFWHEFAHTLLMAHGQYDPASHEEAWVERTGSYLHQFLDTKKPR